MRYASWLTAFTVCLLSASVPATASPGDTSPEDFRIEVSGSGWRPDTRGTVETGGLVVDLVNDLGVEQKPTTFYGRLVVKPGRKHRIIVEGSPFQASGDNTLSRTITYQNRTFTINERVQSSFSVDYLFAGYQYDLVSGRAGHLGLSIGGAYFNFAGRLTSNISNISGSDSQSFGLPLAGMEGRLFPIPHHKILTCEAGVRGMGIGDYGHFLEGTGSGGITVGPITLLAGYRSVIIDLHTTDSLRDGLNMHLHGPIFTAQWRW